MAAPHSAINRQLFQELKREYPEIPDGVVIYFMIQHSNNKNKCLELLAVESPKHMFGEYTAEAPGLPVVQQLGDLSLMDPQSVRQRSDSGSSLKSNASTGSLPCIGSGLVASLANAWPPVTNDNQDSTGRTPDFTPYLHHSKSAGQIPNIECTSTVTTPHRHSGSAVSGEQNFCAPHKTSYTVQPVPSSASGAVPLQMAPHWTPQHGAFVSQMNSNMYPGGQLSKETQQAAHGSGAGHPCVPNSSGPRPQHLSQTTIFIQGRKPVEGGVNLSSMPQVAVQPQLHIQQPPASTHGSRIPVQHFVSKQDQQSQQVAVSANQSNNVLSRYQLGQAIPSHPNVTRPFVVQCNYESRMPQQQVQFSVSSVSPTTTGTFSTPTNPPSLVYQPTFNPPDIPGRRDFMPSTGVPTINYPAQTILDMPNYQTYTTTLPHTREAESPAREDNSAANLYNNMAPVYPAGLQTIGSPASSQSSASSEASHREGRSHRSGSVAEEREYIKALLSHQQVRKEKLESDLERETKKLEQIRGHVTQMEKNMAESSEKFPTVEAIARLRDSNRKLLTEIQCMTREIDMYNQGRTPLGIRTAQDEQFFQHLDQGRPAPMPNIGMPVPHPVPRPLPPHTHGHSPQRSTQTLPPPRTSKPLPNVPPPLPNITAQVPPAPRPQPHSSSGDSEEGEQWSCTACTFLNHPALNKCECCEMPRINLGSK